MKGFLRKKWHSIPVGIAAAVLMVLLLVGSVFAAYTFMSFTTEIEVDEPLEIEMQWWDYNENVWTDWWWVTGDTLADELTMEMSPAETQTLKVRIYNASYGSLQVNTVFSGQTAHFAFNGWPNGTIPASDGDNGTFEWEGKVTVVADGSTPPGTYSVKVKFERS